MRRFVPIAAVALAVPAASSPVCAQFQELNELRARLAAMRETPVRPAGELESSLRLPGRAPVPSADATGRAALRAGGAENAPGRAGSANTVTYQYDDGDFERGFHTSRHLMQMAQRFRLPEAGTVEWIEACFWKSDSDPSGFGVFAVDIHADRSARPGASLLPSDLDTAVSVDMPSAFRVYCRKVDVTQRLPAGDVWVTVLWFGQAYFRDEGYDHEPKRLAADEDGRGNTVVLQRYIDDEGGDSVVSAWSELSSSSDVRAVGLRMAVDHGTTTPPPPPPTGGCTPTSTVLELDGGYEVSMCYRKPDGTDGQARAGIWASSQSGLLWFFTRDNAEVLVKVLNGCAHNGHRWVFVAPVTDLHFNLWITGPTGQRWTHTNKAGTTAATRSDTAAFRCR